MSASCKVFNKLERKKKHEKEHFKDKRRGREKMKVTVEYL